jgi:ATP-dependent Lhr-like helicase
LLTSEDCKKRLKFTWTPFFARFPDLTPVQKEAVSPVLAGENLVISAPLASGKTEAVLAPLIEDFIQKGFKDLSILYVVPTRALVNDLFLRLSEPLDYLDLHLERKTGDHSHISRKRPPFLLITTPESLDSLLSRNPSFFETLRAVVLDDLHLMDGTYRGDQLRILLERIRLIRGGSENLRYYILSATLPDPEPFGGRYIDLFRTIEVPPSRDIKFYMVPWADQRIWEGLSQDWIGRNFRKILVFCSTKKEAENVASQLKQNLPYLEPIVVHHGSLSKKKREENEEVLRKRSTGICVATTTLEVGIDIGDVDAVCLDGPPHSVSSLLQRIGRGSRRNEVIHGYGLYRSAVSKALFEILVELAQNLELEEGETTFDLSVVVQQIFSYIHQKRRIGTSLKSLCRLFRPFGIPEQTILNILNNLLERGYILRNESSLYFTGEKTQRLIDHGGMHTNIPDQYQGELEVVDHLTNEVLGHIEKVVHQFILAGRYWEVAYILKRRVYVREIKVPSGLEYKKAPFDSHLRLYVDFFTGSKVKTRMFEGYLEDYEIPFVQRDDFFLVFHFLGLLYGEILRVALERTRNLKIRNVEGLFFVIEGTNELVIHGMGKISMEDLLSVLKFRTKGLLQLIQLGRFFYLLPNDIQWAEFLRRVRIQEFHKFISRVKFKKVHEDFMRRFI